MMIIDDEDNYHAEDNWMMCNLKISPNIIFNNAFYLIFWFW